MRASVAVGLYLCIGALVAVACSAQHADDYPNLGAPNGLANRAPPDLSGGPSTAGDGGTTGGKEGGGGQGGGGGWPPSGKVAPVAGVDKLTAWIACGSPNN